MGLCLLWPALLVGVMWGASTGGASTGSNPEKPAPENWLKANLPPPRVVNVLANTQWRLVEFQSMDDAQGTRRPESPARYVLRLDADGTATLWMNCNRVTGSWVAEPAGKSAGREAGGKFEFSHVPERTKPCPRPGMEENMLRHMPRVRSFVLKQGRLHLAVMADSGFYVWSRDAAAATKASSNPATNPDTASPAAEKIVERPAPAAATTGSNWQVTRRVNLREQPSTQSRVLALLNAGTRLVRGECQAAEGREWCKVTVPAGGEGFVAAEYLKASSAKAATPPR